jgi:hypothetical protein
MRSSLSSCECFQLFSPWAEYWFLLSFVFVFVFCIDATPPSPLLETYAEIRRFFASYQRGRPERNDGGFARAV